MNIFITIIIILIIIVIFSLPIVIAERWMNNLKRIPPKFKTPIRRKRYVKKTQVKSDLTLLFESIIIMQTKIAKSDGVISAAEANTILNTIDHFIFLARQNGFNDLQLSQLRQSLIESHKKAKVDKTMIAVYAYCLLTQPFYTREQVLHQLISIAVIDGYTQLKESLIFNAGVAMGFSSLQIRRTIDDQLGIKKEPSKKSKNKSLYDILGCKSTDSNATIKRSYRELVKKYHPDRMHAQDSNESDVIFAQKKMQEINMAYEKIKKERKI